MMDRHRELGAIVDSIAKVFDRDTAHEVGKALTCEEVELLIELLRSRGHEQQADMWIGEHALGDDVGDAHYTV